MGERTMELIDGLVIGTMFFTVFTVIFIAYQAYLFFIDTDCFGGYH
jgi:hypothetical protein